MKVKFERISIELSCGIVWNIWKAVDPMEVSSIMILIICYGILSGNIIQFRLLFYNADCNIYNVLIACIDHMH